MARILATWELGLGYGHVANVAPVASALAAQGHALLFAARDPVAAHRATPAPFSGIVQAPVYAHAVRLRETLTYGQVIAEGGFVDAPSVIALVRAWLTLFDLAAPDALLVEHAPISLLAAHIAGIRAVRIGPSFTAPPAELAGMPLLPWVKHSHDDIAAANRTADEIVRAACDAFGAARCDGLAELLHGAPAFALSWPELDHYGPRPDGIYHGPLSGLKASARPEWPEGRGPRALVYLRFDRPAGRKVADALAALGWPAIWHAPQPPPWPLAPNIHCASEPVDLPAMARQADFFIGRGGHGGSCMVLRAGIPQLLFPDTLESLLVTWRLRQAGVARSQSGGADVAEIRAAIAGMAAAPALQTAARRFGAVYAGYDPETAAENLAGDILSTLDLVPR